MRRFHLSPAIFLVTYSCVYVAALAADLPLFRFYPLHGVFCWGVQRLSNQGPPIVWYGLEADAILLALIAAFIIKDRLLERARDRLWWFPVAAMIGTVYLMRLFFE